MQYTSSYSSPLGEITMASDGKRLTGLWFVGQKFYAHGLDSEHETRELPVFRETQRWLTMYFSGQQPDFRPLLHISGTPFQQEVWQILTTIPYGQTMTYGEIARQIAQRRGISHMSAQAVGRAVGRNEISILIPCHRVLGSHGNLTGYAGGIDKKTALLKLEGYPVE